MEREANYTAVGAFVLLIVTMAALFVYWYAGNTDARDYKRYDAEGRILFKNFPEDWEKYTLAFPVIRMPNVTGAGLMRHCNRVQRPLG